MLMTLTKREHELVSKDHRDTIKQQGVMYNRYMTERFFQGDFPNEHENAYIINVIEPIFEDVLMLERAIAAPSVGECYENILSPSLRFGKNGPQYRRTPVIPVVYKPAVGDIVTLPVHLMAKAAESDQRLTLATNWSMVITEIDEKRPYVYEYKVPRGEEESPVMVDKVKIQGVSITVAPQEFPDEPFTFSQIPMMHYILLNYAKEASNDIIGE